MLFILFTDREVLNKIMEKCNRTLCENINEKGIGKEYTLKGWVMRHRDHGGLIFIDLRDYSGIIQIVFDENIEKDLFAIAKKLKNEYVLSVTGIVRKRPEGTENEQLKTGKIELLVNSAIILNTCETLPFQIEEETEVNELIRLKYRYLDLRRKGLKDNLIFRSKFTFLIREFLNKRGFLDIETPFLTKSTPEGSRDFLVPSRLNRGHFFALPQSPQLFKQILMVSGFEKYYQIVRCFRDEDLRADRQPEFTQLDMEMSFVEMDDIMAVTEEFFVNIFETLLDIKINIPFKILDYEEAMDKYGSDKPDTRFELTIACLSDVFANASLNVFRDALHKGGTIKAICLPNGANILSRKDIDGLLSIIKDYGGKGLAWTKVGSDKALEGGISKFITDKERIELIEKLSAKNGDIIFYQADTKKIANSVLGKLRLYLAKNMGLSLRKLSIFCGLLTFHYLNTQKKKKRLFRSTTHSLLPLQTI